MIKLSKKKQTDTGSEFYIPFRKIDRPDFADTLRFPSDVTAIDSQVVSNLHGKYTQLFAFASQEAMLASVQLLKLRAKKDQAIKVALCEYPQWQTLEKWRRDANLETVDEVHGLSQAELRAQIELKIAEGYMGIFEKYLVALSRELSRKGFEADKARTSFR